VNEKLVKKQVTKYAIFSVLGKVVAPCSKSKISSQK